MEKSDLKYYILTNKQKKSTKKPLWISKGKASSLYYLYWDGTEQRNKNPTVVGSM